MKYGKTIIIYCDKGDIAFLFLHDNWCCLLRPFCLSFSPHFRLSECKGHLLQFKFGVLLTKSKMNLKCGIKSHERNKIHKPCIPRTT